MKIYSVGGSVRDELLGIAVQDRDHVVVGADPAEMVKRGFRPVGADFPVFLHPETHEEYALARTERKAGRGYRGFVFHTSPAVTLEDDLARRDLTINAMARGDDGALIDPLGDDFEFRVREFASLKRHMRVDVVVGNFEQQACFGVAGHDGGSAVSTANGEIAARQIEARLLDLPGMTPETTLFEDRARERLFRLDE